jgi:hypothetical protein
MVHSDVGVRCRSCSPPVKRLGISRGVSALGIGVAVILGVVAIGAIGGAYSGNDGSDIDDYLDGYPYPEFAPPDITVEQIVDPWTGDSDRDASPGHHYVAIEVVVEGTEDDEIDYGYTDAYYFKLTDSEGFAYPAIYEGAKPMLAGVDLEPGEKTRGWLTFEVADGNDVASLSYFNEAIPLP